MAAALIVRDVQCVRSWVKTPGGVTAGLITADALGTEDGDSLPLPVPRY
jgi:hypothetical protein